MNITFKANCFFLFLTVFIHSSCEIEEGKNGRGEISGQVMIRQIVDFSIIGGPSDSIVNEYPAIDERVYIRYGNNTVYDDDFDTGANGFYKFKQLSKGDYTLFVYSNCDLCDNEVIPVFQSINLPKHKSQIENVNFFIEK